MASVVHLPGQGYFYVYLIFFCACVFFPCCFSLVFLFKTNSPEGEGKTNMFVFPLVLRELLFVRSWIHIDVFGGFFLFCFAFF